MEQEGNNETLYIPQGLKQKREYYEGFGKKELFITVIATLIGFIFDLLFYFISHNIIAAVVIFMAIPTTVATCIVKDNNISVVDQMRFMIQFSKSQKIYYYVYQDEMK